MDLYAMLYQRLISSEQLASVLAEYAGRPAVFYQNPPVGTAPEWGEKQYPRIEYIIDMQENPARNTSGMLALNIWCDTASSVAPEAIEPIIRDLLHAVFVQAGEETFCFSWGKSDSFEATTDAEKTVRTIGVTVFFDIMACPCQYTLYPDPIKAMNQWTKAILPDAIVIGEDRFDGWIVPTRERPVIYWRLTAQGIRRKTLVCTWLDVSIEGHVYARTAADRLFNLVRINTAWALEHHVPMEDTSPLFLPSFTVKPQVNYLSQGQIQAKGNFGLLQEWYKRGSTAQPIKNINFSEKE